MNQRIVLFRAAMLFAAPAWVGCDDELTASGSAALSGDMGNLSDFATQNASLRADAAGSQVRIDALGDGVNGWAMASLSFGTPLSDPHWSPGATYDSSDASDSRYVGVL